jgi:hypothetical protein
VQRRIWLAHGAAWLTLSACGDRGTPVPVSGSAASTVVPPSAVERPPGVEAVATFGQLVALHELLKDHYDTGFVASHSWAGTAVALLGLPLQAAQTVDEAAPIRLLSASAGERLIAIPLRNADELLALATAGLGARFRRVTKGPIDFLELLTGAGVAELCVVRNALVAARSREGLEQYALHLATPEAASFSVLQAVDDRDDAPLRARVLAAAVLREVSARLGAAPAAPLLLREVVSASLQPLLAPRPEAELSMFCRISRELLALDLVLAEGASLGSLSPIAKQALFEMPAGPAVSLVLGDAQGGPLASEAALALLPAELRPLVDALQRIKGGVAKLSVSIGRTGRLALANFALERPSGLTSELERTFKAQALLESPPEVALEKIVLNRIGDCYRLRSSMKGLEGAIALRVEGSQLWLGGGQDPLLALSQGFEPVERTLQTAVPRELQSAMPDQVLLLCAVDLGSLLGPRSEEPASAWGLVAIFQQEKVLRLRLVATPLAVSRLARWQ